MRRAIQHHLSTLPPDATAGPGPASCGRGAGGPESYLAVAPQFLHHPLDRPAQRQLIRFVLDMHDGREHSQQDAGMISGKAEVAADTGDISSPVPGGDATIQRPGMHRPEVDRRQGQVACEAERPSQRQQEAISGLQVHRFGNPLHGKPALAGNDCIALDAFMLGELERPFSTNIEATTHRVVGFQKRVNGCISALSLRPSVRASHSIKQICMCSCANEN